MPESNDPYASLGVPPEASFDAVQEARQARLDEVGDDPLARSRVEAAYDAVLMDRLKERQQGRVSTAARSASQREQQAPPAGRPALPALPQLPALPAMRASTASIALPGLALATGREFWFPLAAIGSLLVLSLLPGADARLLLALASIATLLNLQRRLGRFPRAVLFTLLLLVTGLLLGGGLLALVAGQGLALPIGPLQLESLPALLLLLLGALLIA
ncbi:MAG: CPP1-like family protein [Cyanobium sp.]